MTNDNNYGQGGQGKGPEFPDESGINRASSGYASGRPGGPVAPAPGFAPPNSQDPTEAFPSGRGGNPDGGARKPAAYGSGPSPSSASGPNPGQPLTPGQGQVPAKTDNPRSPYAARPGSAQGGGSGPGYGSAPAQGSPAAYGSGPSPSNPGGSNPGGSAGYGSAAGYGYGQPPGQGAQQAQAPQQNPATAQAQQARQGYAAPAQGQYGSGPQAGTAAPQGFGPKQSSATPERRRGPGWIALIAAAVIGALVATGISLGGAALLDTRGDQNSAEEQTTETPDWTKIAAAASPSVVAIQVAVDGQLASQGSGYVYDNEGRIVTNNHVIAAADSANGAAQVVFNNGNTIPAEVVGRDPETDVAVIKLETVPEGVKPLPAGASDKLTVGDPVMALGNPLGLADTVTTGIVSALNRPVTTQNIGEDAESNEAALTITNAIQTDAAINPGNSGGPLIDGDGRVIGLNSAAATLSQEGSQQQGGSIGIGFAIPIRSAVTIADQLIATGDAQHPYLGISLTSDTVEIGGVERGAARVSSVESGSAAEKGGIREGDQIIALNDNPVNSGVSLQALIRSLAINDQVTVTVVRNNQEQNLKVTLAAK